MRGLVPGASQRWGDNNQSEERLSSGGSDQAWVTPSDMISWSSTVTNKHRHCHSTHYLSYTSQHSKHIVTSDQAQIITQQTQKSITISFISACPLGIHYLSWKLETYLALSKLYVSLTAGGCSILPVMIWWEMRCVRLCDTRNLWLCWPASPGHWLSPHICGLWPSDDNTRMWDTKNHASLSWTFSVFSAKVMLPVPMFPI